MFAPQIKITLGMSRCLLTYFAAVELYLGFGMGI